jgi:hypothetical protein
MCSIIDFAVFWCYLGQICIKFGSNLASKLKIYSVTTPSNDAIWDKFSEQHQHQRIKKRTIFNAQLALF